MTTKLSIKTLGGESFLISEPEMVHTYATRNGVAYEVFYGRHAVGFYPRWFGLEIYSLVQGQEKRGKISSRVQNRKEVEAWLLAHYGLDLVSD